MIRKNDLTDNFGRWEFFVSSKFPNLAKIAMYSRDVDKIDDRIYLLCKFILQPVRYFINEPITINSGYRDFNLNKANNGTDNSMHMKGKAADWTLEYKNNLYICYDFIKDNLPYSELFLYRDTNKDPVFIHVALADISKKEPKHGFMELT